MRKLASIRRIDAINPIPDADAIDVATIGGWNVVVKKGEFDVGEFVLYHEIDSILPIDNPTYEFLMARSSGKYTADDGSTVEGHRLRTIKLRGTTSQGLITKIETLFEVSEGYITGIINTRNDKVTGSNEYIQDNQQNNQ